MGQAVNPVKALARDANLGDIVEFTGYLRGTRASKDSLKFRHWRDTRPKELVY